ncbi:MFS transporter [Paraburkholderia sp. MMS20-SJTR3]|uniref:MFS transporter n=1 Tax=Paraburkholderia sejongensis TaxID=2886946 RepID=A0ABS8K1X4_9BURK|nr:MFS transporter [Paraburkholderia sp. MMS20-SJTR3]MCC8396000.1 MFS transporter [Paraburkholderia sp. MMS20-SJTR3]
MSREQRGTLTAAGLGFVVVLLDVSAVNVALGALRYRFATDISGLQWVVNAYTLAFASLLLTTGTLGDRLGAKRIFAIGFVVFTLASIACGLANTLSWLVAARVIQGIGAALLVPNSLAMLRQAFPDTEQRNRAVGWWGALGAIALAAGPVLGGLLVTQVGWRSIFLINLPIGVAGVVLAIRYAAAAVTTPGRGIDFPGQLTAVFVLIGVTVSLTEAAQLGWHHPLVYGGLLVSTAFTMLFLWLESSSAEPMLPLQLFRTATFSTATVAGVIVNFAYYGLIFVFSLFFQQEQLLSAQQTGFAFLPMTVVLMGVNILASRLLGRLGAKRLMIAGMLIAASGYLLLLPVSISGSYWTLVVPMVIAASGIAVIVPTMTNVTLSSVAGSRSGIAAGILNCARQIGGLLGVAVFGYLVRDSRPDAFLRGMHLSLTIAATTLLCGAVMCLYGIAVHRQVSSEASCKALGSGS